MVELPRRAVGGLTALAVLTVASCARRSHAGAPATRSASDESTSMRFPDRPVVGFVGDSFSFGTGASTSALRWTSRVCVAERWNEVDVAIPGMGYVTGGRTRSYVAQMATLAPHRPSMIVVSGGWNDVAHGYPTARIVEALRATLDAAARSMPTARVVVIAPLGGAKAPPAALMRLRDALEPVVRATGAAYVDLDFVLTGHPEWVSTDGLHPNDAGHARLADLSAPSLRRALTA